MDRLDLLAALAEAEARIAQTPLISFGPPDEPPPEPPPPRKGHKPRWTGRPRKNSKQARRERGGLI